MAHRLALPLYHPQLTKEEITEKLVFARKTITGRISDTLKLEIGLYIKSLEITLYSLS